MMVNGMYVEVSRVMTTCFVHRPKVTPALADYGHLGSLHTFSYYHCVISYVCMISVYIICSRWTVYSIHIVGSKLPQGDFDPAQIVEFEYFPIEQFYCQRDSAPLIIYPCSTYIILGFKTC